VHVKPLAALFGAKMRAALRQLHLDAQIAPETWQQAWVVDCRPVATGLTALKYLARYIFRVALSNNRILRVENDQVTFRYTVGESGQTRYCRLPAEEFMRRFLQQVLPKGLVKVRYYGLFSPSNRQRLAHLGGLLALSVPALARADAASLLRSCRSPEPSLRCPRCGEPMHLVQIIPHGRSPPAESLR
jgi:hypothetical protein